MESFPSNSFRTPNTSREEVSEVKRVTTGEVVRRKPPLSRRMAQSLVGGNVENVWGYVFGELLIPAVRDMISEAGRGLIDGVIYGESHSRSSHRGGRGGGAGYTAYNRYSSPPARREGRDRDDRRDISRRARATHSFDEIIIDSRVEAEEVLRSLDHMIERYEAASVAHLYEMLGISSSFTDQKWGWTSLRDARVQRVREGYLLDLPRPEPID